MHALSVELLPEEDKQAVLLAVEIDLLRPLLEHPLYLDLQLFLGLILLKDHQNHLLVEPIQFKNLLLALKNQV
jgi:hypothetical protein